MPDYHRVFTALVVIALLASPITALASAGEPDASSASTRMIVAFDALPRDLDAGDDWHGASVLRVSRALGHAVVLAADPDALRAHARDDANVRYVEEDFLVSLSLTPNDPRFGEQYGPQHIRAPRAWDASLGEPGSGRTLCVVDSGIRMTHEDLAGSRYLGGYDFYRGDGTPEDENGHGTHVTGTAAGSTNNAKGIAGIAQVGYYVAKTFRPDGQGYVSDISDGIRWCGDQGADVMSMSFGGSYSSSINDAVNYAWDRGILPVAAAGNDGPCSNCVGHPASMANVIAVSCTGSADSQCSFSSDGPEIDLAAPGDDILAPYKNGDADYQVLQGTSMSTPHVSGAAVLLWSKFPYLTRQEVRDLLEDNAKDLGPAGWDQQYGWGLVDVGKAMDSVLPPPVETRVYYEDFDDGAAQGWTSSSLWHVDSKCTTPPSSPNYLGFQDDGFCDYNANALGRVTGSASFAVDLSGMVSASIKLKHRFEVESSSSVVDIMRIEASANGGSSYATLAQWDARNGAAAWGDWSGSLKDYMTANARIRFTFDTVDQFSNNHPGWFLDNVEVLASDNYPPLARAGVDVTASDPDGDGTGAVALDGTASADSDGTIATYEWLEGATLVATGPTPTATLSVGAHTLTLRVTDDDGDSSTDTVIATVTENIPPVARAGPDLTASDPDGDGFASVALDGTASSDADGTVVEWSWFDGSDLVATGATPTASFAVGSRAIQLVAKDNGYEIGSDYVQVTVNPNVPPVAAFTYSCDGLSCTFNAASSSDADGSIVARSWEFGDGSTYDCDAAGCVAAGGAVTTGAADKPVHAFAAAGSYTVNLTVTDEGGGIGTLAKTFDPTAPPGIAVAFDGGVAPGWTLTGLWRVTSLCSTPPSAPNYLGYHGASACTFQTGARTTGSATFGADLTSATTSEIRFKHRFQVQSSSSVYDIMRVEASADDGATWTTLAQWDSRNGAQTAWSAQSRSLDAYAGQVVKLRFWFDSVDPWSNSGFGWMIDDVEITNAFPVNFVPVARAGVDVTLADADGSGSEATTLDGSASEDEDGTLVSYEWLEGGNVLATGATASVALGVGTHAVTLRVTDNDGATATDALVVTVNANAPPVARAGADASTRDSDGTGAETFALDGSASADADGTLAAFEWLEGATLLATGATASVPFTVGTHTVTLRVTDNGGAARTDALVVTVLPNLAPVAAAGADVTVDDFDGDGGQPVAFDGRGSGDPDGTIQLYEWLEGSTVLATGPTPTAFVPDGVHAITLRVTDNGGATATDGLVVTVNTNRPPTASFSWTCVGLTCTLSSACSSDPEGTLAGFTWQFGDGATGSGETATHTYASAGSFTARLTVMDAAGATGDAASAVTAYATAVLPAESPPANPEVRDTPSDVVGDRVPARHLDVQSAWFQADGARTYIGMKVGDILSPTQANSGAAYEVAFLPAYAVADPTWGGAVPSGFTLQRIRALAFTSPVTVESDGAASAGVETAPVFQLRAYSTQGTQFRDAPLAEVTGVLDAGRDVVWWVVPHTLLQNPAPGALVKTPVAKAALSAGPAVYLGQYQAASDFTPAGRDYRYPGGCAASGIAEAAPAASAKLDPSAVEREGGDAVSVDVARRFLP